MSHAQVYWTPRTVAWYRRALERSDYAERVLGVLAALLPTCATALDVGAGCGALALPLAARLRHVTAIEPASAMAEALREGARTRALAHLEVVEAAWDDTAVEPCDLVLCAHVGPLLRPEAAFLREVSSAARRFVALVQDTGRERDRFFFHELYPTLLGRPYGPGCQHEETVAALAALGITPEVARVSYRSDQPFDDLEDACDFWETHLGVSGAQTRGFLREFLAARLTREAAGWVAPYRKEVAVIWWAV